jgi:putative phosphoribosyl transferase
MKRFENRLQAGALLARRLAKYREQESTIVLALPRGGVPVAFSVAKKLALPFDVLPVRKLGIPGREETAMGAIAEGGLCVMKSEVLDMFRLDTALVDAVAYRELHEIERQSTLYRAHRPVPQLQRRTVILVDDGLATGATMMAAVKTVRKQHPARLVVAVPVGAPSSCTELLQYADDVVSLLMPRQFYAVSAYYQDFSQVSDDEVLDLLEQSQHWQPLPTAGVPNTADAYVPRGDPPMAPKH